MLNALENLSFYTSKAFKWADENNIEHAKLLEHSLAPDMLNFTKQIIIATDHAKFVLARVAGVDVPKWEDNEKTLDELLARLQKAVDLLRAADAKAFEGQEQKDIHITPGGREIDLTGLTYVQYWALPNFWFHVTTAYDLLRNMGAPLGKADFLAGGRATLGK